MDQRTLHPRVSPATDGDDPLTVTNSSSFPTSLSLLSSRKLQLTLVHSFLSFVCVGRQVLERTITLQLPAKKMKTLFQKFLEFETAHGDQDRLDYVRRKALEYVESKSAVADE